MTAKILVVGDCHGKIPEIEEENFDLILAVGDICGENDEARTVMFESRDSDKHWYKIIGEEKAEEIVEKSLKEGREVLEKLDSFNVPILVVPGNWDWNGEIYEEWDFLEENGFQQLVNEFDNVQNLNRKKERIKEITVIGYGPCSGPEIPQYKDNRPEDESEMEEMKKDYRQKKEELENLFENSGEPVIFLSHNVPFDTELDKIDNEDSPVHGRHYGSLIVKELIEEYQPMLSVAGHMHEGEGKEELGKTLAINTGLHTTWELEIEGREVSVNLI